MASRDRWQLKNIPISSVPGWSMRTTIHSQLWRMVVKYICKATIGNGGYTVFDRFLDLAKNGWENTIWHIGTKNIKHATRLEINKDSCVQKGSPFAPLTCPSFQCQIPRFLWTCFTNLTSARVEVCQPKESRETNFSVAIWWWSCQFS